MTIWFTLKISFGCCWEKKAEKEKKGEIEVEREREKERRKERERERKEKRDSNELLKLMNTKGIEGEYCKLDFNKEHAIVHKH